MSRFTSIFRPHKNGTAAEHAEAGQSVKSTGLPRCYVNPRTGCFVHGRPHTCAVQARSGFKPRKKRKEYRRRERKQSRTRVGR